MQDILSEVIELFPSQFIHTAATRRPRDRWKQCPKCQARIKALGFEGRGGSCRATSPRACRAFLASKGRRLVGWDEILEGGLAPGATVMSWRGMAGRHRRGEPATMW